MKKFFREHGIWVLFATAVIAVSLSLMSFFSNTSSPLSNLAGMIASPFRPDSTSTSRNSTPAPSMRTAVTNEGVMS